MDPSTLDCSELRRLKNSLTSCDLHLYKELDIGQVFIHRFKTGEGELKCSWEASLLRVFSGTKVYLVLRETDLPEIEVVCKCFFNYRTYDLIFRFTARKDHEEFLFKVKHNMVFNIMGIALDIKVKPPRKYFAHKILDLPQNSLKDFDKLVDDETFADVKFITPNGTVFAHKGILIGRSPVFYAMFTSGMKESQTGEIEVPSNPDDLKEMLRFIYTGCVKDLDDRLEALLQLSNKYGISKLKALCESTLFKRVTIDNAIETLKFCDKHDADGLKRLTMNFIVEKGKKILDTTAFAELMESNGDIALDIVKLIERGEVDSGNVPVSILTDETSARVRPVDIPKIVNLLSSESGYYRREYGESIFI